MPEVTEANWMEVIGLCLQAVTALVAVLIAISHGAQWVFWSRHLSNLDRRQKQIDVARSEGESVSVLGQIHGPDLFVVDGNRSLPVCPVFVQIKNEGAQAVQVARVEFRVFVASVRDVAALTPVDPPERGVVLAAGADVSQVWSRSEDCIVGMIDPDSPAWVERAELCQAASVTNGGIPPGQTRFERRHLISPINLSSILTKVEVTVHTLRSKQRWYGFPNPHMCAPEPFPAGVGEYEHHDIASPPPPA